VKRLLLIAFAVLTVRASAQLSLTPSVSERMQEGFKFPQLEFSDAGKKVTYEQPRGWSYSSQGKQQIAFYPPHPTQTKAEIQSGFPVAPTQFDEEGLKQLKTIFLSLLPKESEQVEIVAEQKNPVLINRHETYDITAAFINHGQRYRMSVLFVNLEREQIRCKVIAEPNDFQEAHRLFIESLCGLQWL
jgi:hypothetical protein